MPPLPPVTKWLLILNVGIFLIDLFLPRDGRGDGPISSFGEFSVASAISGGRIWEFLTFQFIHASVLHVMLNSLGLYFFGPLVERWWGSKKFIGFYLICGAAGALFFTLLLTLKFLPKASAYTPLVGASAGLYGILFAVYVIAPAIRVRLLFPPIELSMKQMAIALFVISAGTIIGGLLFPNSGIFSNEGGEAGHLGGAIMGFVLMKFPWLLSLGKREKKIIHPKEFRRNQAKIRPRTELDLEKDTEVDRILDKINEQGVDSLTKAERETLSKISTKDS
ncbi:rhomboid family intramembrane serine protease [Haloferula chungangensis]|uniref:Rhomboid family intramembrane serine protease n=1 Tax=Haloferula chungangensis TaxID=1048331 RepID=A0ABW2LBM2_9BACT